MTANTEPEDPIIRKRPGGHQQAGDYPLARAGFIEYDRVLFFSDAVFAIAITLLAVNLHVPTTSGGGSIGTGSTASALRHELPRLIGFGISFAVIALFWLGHHGIFRYITAFDRPLIGLNLLFLGTIAFLPFPTEVLSATSRPDAGAAIFYAACGAAAGLAEGAIWLYATRARAGLTDPSAARVRLHFTLRIARVPVVFLASIPVALVAPGIAAYLWISIWIVGIAINRLAPPRDEPDGSGG